MNMSYMDLPMDYRTKMKAYVDDVIANGRQMLVNEGCVMPTTWDIVDALCVGSFGLMPEDCTGDFPTMPSQFGTYKDIDIRFISTGPIEDVHHPTKPKIRNRLFHFMRYYCPLHHLDVPLHLQLDIQIHDATHIVGRHERPYWKQSARTGFSLVDGKSYVDAEDYINNSGKPLYYPY